MRTEMENNNFSFCKTFWKLSYYVQLSWFSCLCWKGKKKLFSVELGTSFKFWSQIFKQNLNLWINVWQAFARFFWTCLACRAPAPWPTMPKMRSSLLLMAIPLPLLEQPGLIIHKLRSPSISICWGQILLSFSSVLRAWSRSSSLLLLPS